MHKQMGQRITKRNEQILLGISLSGIRLNEKKSNIWVCWNDMYICLYTSSLHAPNSPFLINFWVKMPADFALICWFLELKALLWIDKFDQVHMEVPRAPHLLQEFNFPPYCLLHLQYKKITFIIQTKEITWSFWFCFNAILFHWRPGLRASPVAFLILTLHYLRNR